MLQEGQAEAESGRDVVIGYLEPHDRAGDRRAGRRARGRAAAQARLPRHAARGDGPAAVLARAPELCLIDELAHTTRPGVEHEKRYEDIAATCSPPGSTSISTVNVQHLESLNDQIAELTGSAGARDDPRPGPRRRRRGRADRRHAGGADQAPARRQGLPARARPGGARTTSSRSRTSRRCARPRCARSPRRSRMRRLLREAAPVLRRDEEGRPRGRRRRRSRSPSGCWRWSRSTALRARRAARVALGAAARRRARRARRASAGPRGERPGPRAGRGAPAPDVDARRAPARRGGRRRRRGRRRASRARLASPTSCSAPPPAGAWHVAARRRAFAGLAARSSRRRVWTSGSSPTPRCARRRPRSGPASGR